MSIQSRIESALPSMSPSLARIATAIGEAPSLVLSTTISELAQQCNTSVASVVRFCNAIGLSGYAQLRMEMARELGEESAQFGMEYGSEISEHSTLQEIASNIAALEILAIQDTLKDVDFRTMANVVEQIDHAKRVVIFGMGASGYVAQDLAHKLLRIGRFALHMQDSQEARSVVALPAPGTVAIAVSHSGETFEAVEFLKSAKKAGAYAVAITNVPESTLAQLSNAQLITQVRETALRAGATVSRIAQLALIDALFAGVVQVRYQETVEALRITHEATLNSKLK